MRGLLYFTWFNWEYVAAGVYQYLIDEKEITELTIITCDGYNLPCHSNYNSDPIQCKLCKLNKNYFLANLKKYKSTIEINHHTIESLIAKQDSSTLMGLSLNQIEEDFILQKKSINNYLSSFEYGKSNIGAGILSTYISHTRNYRPLENAQSKLFFFKQLSNLTHKYNYIENFLLENKFDLFALFNGRSNDTRAIFDLFVGLGSDKTFVIENLIVADNLDGEITELGVELLPALLPQDIKYRGNQIECIWQNANPQKRRSMGESYFKERIKELNIKKHKDLFSQKWNSKQNPFLNQNKVKVVIFNSSSDEIASIPELKEYNFFGEQNDAITKLLRLLYTSNEFEVVLRIHPNLGSVQYKYHLELYNLKHEFKDLIIFEAAHSINSYELISYSDLVITFGSTIGVEATYLNKPVINLGAASYFEIDVTYNPRTMEELITLIQNSRKLLPKPLENALKYGYYRNQTIDYSKFVARVHKFWGVFTFYNYQKPILIFQFLKRMIFLKDTFQPPIKRLSSIPMLEEK